MVALGFGTITFYFVLTIFYPLVELDAFMGQAVHKEDEMQRMLVGRYIDYLPLMIFGTTSVIAGNWFRQTKKEVDNAVLGMAVTVLVMSFVAVMQISIDAESVEIMQKSMDIPQGIQKILDDAKNAMMIL